MKYIVSCVKTQSKLVIPERITNWIKKRNLSNVILNVIFMFFGAINCEQDIKPNEVRMLIVSNDTPKKKPTDHQCIYRGGGIFVPFVSIIELKMMFKKGNGKSPEKKNNFPRYQPPPPHRRTIMCQTCAKYDVEFYVRGFQRVFNFLYHSSVSLQQIRSH